jgi:hypothetical protein
MITPTEAKAIEPQDEPAIKAAEEKIDKALRVFVNNASPVWVDIDGLKLSAKARTEIVNRYEAAGWDVTVEYSQRPGDSTSLKFRERQTTE